MFEISSTGVGTFEIAGRFMGVSVDKVELVFQVRTSPCNTLRLHYAFSSLPPSLPPSQDLLQLQYEGLAVMNMFGRAKINVNLLIHLINKKFYSRVA